MLRSLKEIEGFTIAASDGEIGKVKNFYFDDSRWVVRYLIVETGTWLDGRLTLVSPIGLGKPRWDQRQLPTRATREQVRKSPSIDLALPVSRQHELLYGDYYGYPYYWGGVGLWGADAYPGMVGADRYNGSGGDVLELENDYRRNYLRNNAAGDPHLRSAAEVFGYHIHASDGNIGHVEDILIDDENWAIRDLVANTSNWWMGHKILLVPQWIERVSWASSEIYVDLSLQEIRDAPVFDPAVGPDRALELATHSHYHRRGYWMDRDPFLTEASLG